MRWVVGLVSLVLIAGGLAYVFRESIAIFVMSQSMKPEGAFADYAPPSAPDYSRSEGWAALPEAADTADFTPNGLPDLQSTAGVAAFYVHPTTFLKKTGWNAPLDDPEAQGYIHDAFLKGQASAFNGCCSVYAPQYRQATFWSYLDETGSGDQAFDLAYSDVGAAFEAFLARLEADQPFILAGHSQGAQHLFRLMKERVSGTPLVDRLVAAYPVGFPEAPEAFTAAAPDIPLCETPTQTRCYVTWNALSESATIRWEETEAACVNPLSWRTDGEPVPASENPGSLSVYGEPRFEPGVTGARCAKARVIAGPFQSDLFDDLPIPTGPGDYHILDYALFYGSIRQNAIDRVAAFRDATP